MSFSEIYLGVCVFIHNAIGRKHITATCSAFGYCNKICFYGGGLSGLCPAPHLEVSLVFCLNFSFPWMVASHWLTGGHLHGFSFSSKGFKSTLLVKSVKKFFKRHCTTVVRYNVALRELRSAVRD